MAISDKVKIIILTRNYSYKYLPKRSENNVWPGKD